MSKRSVVWWTLELVSFAMVMYIGHVSGRVAEVRIAIEAQSQVVQMSDSIVTLRSACESGASQ